MTDTSLDPKIVARFRAATPPYLGTTYVRIAQDIRDEAVADLETDRDRLQVSAATAHEAADAAAEAVGAMATKLTSLMTERDQLTEQVTELSIACQDDEGRMLDLRDEQDRLRRVVDAARAFIGAQVDADSTAERDFETWDRMMTALEALDVNPPIGDRPLRCDNCGQTIPEHLRPSGLLTCQPELPTSEEDRRT